MPRRTVSDARTLMATAFLTCAKAVGTGALLLAASVHAGGPSSVTIAGDLQSELGCPGDWAPECATTHLSLEDEVWQGVFSVPAGAWQYKAALDDSWNENYGQNASFNGPNIGLNLDPSHFWWQGIDPVAIVEALGHRIGHSHGKDTLLYPERIRSRGVLHYAQPRDPARTPWHFASVGEGHDDATWVKLFRAMRAAGYDGVISIEHEDPRYDGEEGTTRSIAGLKRILAQTEGVA